MNQYTVLAIALGVCAALLSSSSATASIVPIYCEPNGMQDAHPKLRTLCVALMARMNQQMLDDGDEETQYAPEKKRQDTDHVFLRFGRPMGPMGLPMRPMGL